MTTTMMTALTTPPASLSAFGSQFINALTTAELIGPLVPSDGTNYASVLEQKWNPLTLQGGMDLEKPVVQTLWSGKGDLLPPAYRALPMLLNMPGTVPPSSADLEAQERMRAWYQSKPISWVENVGDKGKLEDGRPSFYNQLSFFREIVELTESQKSIDKSMLAESASKWLRGDEHSQAHFAITAAVKKASTNRPALVADAADDLGNASAIYHEQGLLPLSAIALEASIALYMSAESGRTWKSLQASYLTAQDYLDAVKLFQDREQDPLGYDAMLWRGLSIAMNETMYEYAFGPKDDRFSKLGLELAEISSQRHAENKPKRAAEDLARILWLKTLKAYSDIGAHWICAGDVIGKISSFMRRARESEETVAAINSWAESAYAFAAQKKEMKEIQIRR